MPKEERYYKWTTKETYIAALRLREDPAIIDMVISVRAEFPYDKDQQIIKLAEEIESHLKYQAPPLKPSIYLALLDNALDNINYLELADRILSK